MSRPVPLLTLVTVLAALSAIGCQRDADVSRKADASTTSIRRTVDDAWAEIRRLTELEQEHEAHAFQRRTARSLFDYYELTTSADDDRDELARSAFMMWGNTGDVESVDAAIPKVDPESEAWVTILNSIGNAYGRAGRQGSEYYHLLIELEPRLTHPKSRSQLLLEMSEFAIANQDLVAAKETLAAVIELDAGPFFVKRAEGELYEMHSLGIGQLAPEFSGSDLEGNTVDLTSLKGRTVVLEFWSTSCGPCLPEVDTLRTIHEAYGDRGVAVIGISLDESLDALRQFVGDRSIDWPQVCDGRGFDGEIAGAFNVHGIPRSFVVDRHGRIAAKDQRGDDLVRAIEELLKQG